MATIYYRDKLTSVLLSKDIAFEENYKIEKVVHSAIIAEVKTTATLFVHSKQVGP